MDTEKSMGNTATACQRHEEERPWQKCRKLVAKGVGAIVYRHADTPRLLVSANSKEAAEMVLTTFLGDKLVVEHKGSVITTVDGHNVYICASGSGAIVAGRNIIFQGSQQNRDVDLRNAQICSGDDIFVFDEGGATVTIEGPKCPDIKIKGAASVVLHDVLQDHLKLRIKGSGDVEASGSVSFLDAAISGSGDIDAAKLCAASAHLNIQGSGDLKAYVSFKVLAHVSGSGDITVLGNPPNRQKRVLGSGKIHFR